MSLFSACTNPEEEGNISINSSFLDWINPYATDGEIIQFQSSGGTSSEVEILVTSVDNLAFFADCQIDGTTRQCQFVSAALKFTPRDSTDQYHLAFAITAPNKLWIMPSAQGGLSTPLLSWEEESGILEEAFPNLFTVDKVDDYSFENNLHEAFIITQGERNDFWWGVTVPKKVVILKKRGVVEWEDFQGNTYNLNE